MVKGVSIRFQSYNETIPKLLKAIGFERELKKHEKILLKPSLEENENNSTNTSFVENVLKFIIENKNPGADVFIVEGCDGHDTEEVFEDLGFRGLSEKYGVGLIDLNDADTEIIEDGEFLRFDKIFFPRILQEGFLISLPKLREDEESIISCSLSGMLGAFPASYYKGFFSRSKNKIKKWPLKYSIHDILKCKMPDFAIVDASENGAILAGNPIEMDKQASKLLAIDWKEVPYIRLVDENFRIEENKNKN